MTPLIIRCIILYLIPLIVMAKSKDIGVGRVAENMLQPVGFFSDFVHSACILIGGSFVFASIIKYIEHRRSPTMVPISTVVFLLIAGLALIALPLLSTVTGSGVPYSMFK